MKRSKHSLTHYRLTTCKMGQLVPIAWFEALPGDTIQQATSALVRCAPLVTPVMHPVHVRIHHWFVPNRIIWDGWQDYITGGPDGLNNSPPPNVSMAPVTPGSLADQLGIPTQTGFLNNAIVSALPFRAYALIWNEFYRDEDLQTPLVVSKGSGADTTTSLSLQNISWEKDYLTSSRPFAFKGPSVTIPIATTAPITRAPNAPAWDAYISGTNTKISSTAALTGSASGQVSQAPNTLSFDPNGGLVASLQAATAVDVNTLRHAFALQRFEEARARYGSRYTEYLRYLGVRSSDARLQRPEYLGGGRQTIQFSEVLQTGPNTGGTGIGNMFGHGITALRSNRYRRFFEEHGIVMSLMSVRPRTMYSQRLKRAWFRGMGVNLYSGTTGTKEDYWQRELQHIGQQGICPVEVDSGNNPAAAVFGYQDRYDEYRREESTVAGLFRTTLNNWHLSREFTAGATLNSTFVSCVPSTRVFADLNSDNLYVMANHSIQARRLVSKEGTSHTF